MMEIVLGCTTILFMLAGTLVMSAFGLQITSDWLRERRERKERHIKS